jgi:AAA domain
VAMPVSEVETWFTERPLWLQDAARRIVQNGEIVKQDIEELVALCKAEVGIIATAHQNLRPIALAKGALQGSSIQSSLRLDAILNPRGINALQPRKPLEFGNTPLTVVYGLSGSGKTGYVRLLKHACGGRNPGVLHGDIFSTTSTQQSCTFKCTINGAQTAIDWAPPKGPLEELRAIQIYDTACANTYVNSENEVAFEPFLLRLFTTLTETCVLVSNALELEVRSKPTKKPVLPLDFQSSTRGTWYAELSSRTTTREIEENCIWTAELDGELEGLAKRLAEAKPAQRATELRRQASKLSDLYNELEEWKQRLSDLSAQEYLRARDEAVARRLAADVDANTVFANAPLSGVGSESWKLLWEQARVYSESHAYEGIAFPNTSEAAVCVLCQQPLVTDAKVRLQSFESFVKGGLETEAVQAETQAVAMLDKLAGISHEDLKLRMDSVGVVDESERMAIDLFCTELENRGKAISSAKSVGNLAPLSASTVNFLRDRALQFEQQALAYDEDAKGDNRPKLEGQRKDLETQEWLSQQRASIETEVVRLVAVKKLEEARRLTSTQALSTKKSSMADQLITAAYVARFQEQLRALNAPHIRVQLVKTRAEKGHVYHQIILQNAAKTVPTAHVLSEGEFRIVSLAAFLADMEGHEGKGPFVFDDPISSLDQGFEEATVERLVELSKTRQVIIFTHRLSLMALIEEEAKKQAVEIGISLRIEKWGVGEPSETPINASKPSKALRELSARVQKAKKVLEQSSADYEILAKAICSDFRIIIERAIEVNLLSDVVQRFRRSIITKNKIHKLSVVTAADCQLFDDFMTEYSKYEHSQPQETPISLPQPEKLEADINKLLAWIGEFEKR